VEEDTIGLSDNVPIATASNNVELLDLEKLRLSSDRSADLRGQKCRDLGMTTRDSQAPTGLHEDLRFVSELASS
jgi:hypothetical protein